MKMLDAQKKWAESRLLASPGFLPAVVESRERRLLYECPLSAEVGPADFVAWLSTADQRQAQQVMWSVRAALRDDTQLRADPATQQTAVALYVLCAMRWVSQVPQINSNGALLVPDLPRCLMGILSTAFLGGKLILEAPQGSVRASHVYEIKPLQADGPGDLLLAIHNELYALEQDSTELALGDGDGDEDPTINRVIERINSFIDDVREVQGMSFTLVIPQTDLYQPAHRLSRLECTLFIIDRQLARGLFLMDPDRLEAEITHLLKLWQPTPEASDRPLADRGRSTHQEINDMKPVHPQINNITIHGGNANVNTGAASTITSHVQQFSQAEVAPLMAELASLKADIAALPPQKAREMAQQVQVIEQAITKKPADGKGLVTRTLEGMKQAGEAIEGAEKVVDRITKLKLLAAPFLAAWF